MPRSGVSPIVAALSLAWAGCGQGPLPLADLGAADSGPFDLGAADGGQDLAARVDLAARELATGSERRPEDLAAAIDLADGEQGVPLDSGVADLAQSRDLATPDLRPVADLGTPDLRPPADLAKPVDRGGPEAPIPFLGPLEGIWLVGWSGGLNHFSWVRFTVAGQTQGKAEFLKGKELRFNQPLWDCDGVGSWTITAKPDTIQIHFPPACNLPWVAYTIGPYGPPGNYPPGAILEAPFAAQPGQAVGGYKYPPGQCDAGLTKCVDPL